MSVPFAVVLCGSGRADGSEIHEATAILFHLSRVGAAYRCYAPDSPQAEVVNHATGKSAGGQTRNMLVEAARIARGKIEPLSGLDVAQCRGVLFAGGLGVAKNLCTYATPGDKGGANCDVLPDVERVILAAHKAKKPLGLCCIAPVLAARVLGTRRGGPGVKVTLGNDAAATEAVQTMGSTHVARGVTEVFVDETNRVATTPAYMFGEASVAEVFEGIGKMVEAVVQMAK